MYRTFNEYRQRRDIISIYQKLDEICYVVAESNVDFEKVWQECGLPLMLENQHIQQPEEVADLLLEGFSQWIGDKVGKYGAKALQGIQDFGSGAMQGYQNQIGLGQPQNLNKIKQDFTKSMERLVQSMNQSNPNQPQNLMSLSNIINQWQQEQQGQMQQGQMQQGQMQQGQMQQGQMQQGQQGQNSWDRGMQTMQNPAANQPQNSWNKGMQKNGAQTNSPQVAPNKYSYAYNKTPNLQPSGAFSAKSNYT